LRKNKFKLSDIDRALNLLKTEPQHTINFYILDSKLADNMRKYFL